MSRIQACEAGLAVQLKSGVAAEGDCGTCVVPTSDRRTSWTVNRVRKWGTSHSCWKEAGRLMMSGQWNLSKTDHHRIQPDNKVEIYEDRQREVKVLRFRQILIFFSAVVQGQRRTKCNGKLNAGLVRPLNWPVHDCPLPVYPSLQTHV